MLAITLASGTMANAVSEGTIADYNAEKGTKGHSALDYIVIPHSRLFSKLSILPEGFPLSIR
jgi:hypothetical protein